MAFLSPRHPCRGARVAGWRRIGGAQTVGATRCGTGVHESEATGHVLLPDDQSFCALVADPKEPSTFISYLRGRFRTLDDPSGAVTNIATIGVGDTFGLVRFGGPAAGEGFQLDVIGAIFAQFDVDTPSTDLINTDYIIGVPLTFRRSGFSLRTKLYTELSSRRRVLAARRRNRTRESIVRIVRSARLHRDRAPEGIRRRRASLPP